MQQIFLSCGSIKILMFLHFKNTAKFRKWDGEIDRKILKKLEWHVLCAWCLL